MNEQRDSLATSSTDAGRAPLGPPRYSLRAMLAIVTALGCLFGLMSALGSMWALVLLTGCLLIVAHVVGNSLGTSLRNRASEQVLADRPDGILPAAALPHIVAPQRLTPRARLHPITLVMSIGGALAGGVAGAVLSTTVYPDAPLAALALSVISLSVLGAFGGFVGSSFVSVARQAWREALGGDPSVERRSVRPSP